MSSKPLPTHISLHPTSSLHPLTTITGTHPLTIHAHTYIHLRAHLNNTYSPLTIGSNCIVCEKAIVGLTEEAGVTIHEKGVVLENSVVIESKAIVEGTRIGEGTIVEVGGKVGSGAVVGKYCKIGPLCTVEPYEVVPDHTVIYGYNERRIDRSGTDALRAQTVEQHVDVLKKAEMAARKK